MKSEWDLRNKKIRSSVEYGKGEKSIRNRVGGGKVISLVAKEVAKSITFTPSKKGAQLSARVQGEGSIRLRQRVRSNLPLETTQMK